MANNNTSNRRNELNAEFVRLTRIKDQVVQTLANIDVAMAELDQLEAPEPEAPEPAIPEQG